MGHDKLHSSQLIVDITEIGAKLSFDDSFRSVRPQLVSATNKRINRLCLGLLLSPHLATRTVLGHERLIRGALAALVPTRVAGRPATI